MRTETTVTYISDDGIPHKTAADAKRANVRAHLRKLALRANSVDRLIEAIVEDRWMFISLIPKGQRMGFNQVLEQLNLEVDQFRAEDAA